MSFAPCRQPFLYLTAALVAGILADWWAPPPRALAMAIFMLSFAGALVATLRRRGVATPLLLLGCVAAGALLARAERAGVAPSRLTRLYDRGVITADEPVELTGVLDAPPEPAPDAVYLTVAAESLRAGRDEVLATGQARLILRLADAAAAEAYGRLALDYGSRLRVLVRLDRARTYRNPGAVDFNDYLERQGYDLQGAVKSPLLIEPLGRLPVNRFLAALYRARSAVMRALDARFDRRVAGTLKAMLVGNRHFLDAEAAERLRLGGTYHVLSISGMHVGIIAWALLLGGRVGRGRGRVTHLLLCLAALWAYAVMVGLAPPVTRAAVMITVALLGPLLFRRAVSVNTLALAAFVLLAWQPSLAADPSFQLSFAAVAGGVALALPLTEKLRGVGGWRPTPRTPHPPACAPWVRVLAEALYWDERRFRQDMAASPVRYRLDKAPPALALNRARLQPFLRATAVLVVTSAAIQLTTLPLSALYFNRVSPVGVLLNVAAGLLTAVVMACGAFAPPAAALNACLGTFFQWLGTLAHDLLAGPVVNPFLNLPLATVRVAHYEGGAAAVYALYFVTLGLLALLIDGWRPVDEVKPRRPAGGGRRLKAAWVLPAVAAASLMVIRPPAAPPNGRLTVHFLDVGHGDCALVVFPGGRTMLVDGGGEMDYGRREPGDEETGETYSERPFRVGEAVVSRFLWARRARRVDYALATHADADHIMGLADVVNNFEVGQAVIGTLPARDAELEAFRRAAARGGVPVGAVAAGQRFHFDGVNLEVLWPPPAAETGTSGNNDSVVLRMTYGQFALLLTGDIEQSAEEALISSGRDLRADVLKAPHHGSRTSSSEAFLDAVRPRWAVVPAPARSPFGHPHPEVAARYAARGARLLQTGRDGMVTVVSDGAGVAVLAYGDGGPQKQN